MTTRPLGNSGLQLAPLAFGGNIFGWTVDEPTSFSLLDAFLNAGFNFIDTADIYSKWVPGHIGGESETILGKWLKRANARSKILIATKCGMDLGDNKKGLSKKYILQAAEASLARLQTDHIDLYQSHADDPTTPIEETLEAFDQLIKQGKVRAIGASNFNADRLTQSVETSKKKNLTQYQSLQPHYNLYERADFESNLQGVCQKYNLGVIPYFSLASGFLTGKYRSETDLNKSPRGQGIKKYLNPRGLKILDALDLVSKNLHATPAQIALAWLLTRPTITAPIASATTLPQLQDLIKSTQLKLDPESLQQLNTASAP